MADVGDVAESSDGCKSGTKEFYCGVVEGKLLLNNFLF